jgi:hypothetical protein
MCSFDNGSGSSITGHSGVGLGWVIWVGEVGASNKILPCSGVVLLSDADAPIAKSFEEVQKTVAGLFKDRILVGHAVYNDLKVGVQMVPVRITQILVLIRTLAPIGPPAFPPILTNSRHPIISI